MWLWVYPPNRKRSPLPLTMRPTHALVSLVIAFGAIVPSIYANAVSSTPIVFRDTLNVGEQLHSRSSLWSDNGKLHLTMQLDGNLVL